MTFNHPTPHSIKSASHHRNGVTGEPFYLAIVTNPFAGDDYAGQDFLVTYFPNQDPEGEYSHTGPCRVAATRMASLATATTNDCFRGDHISQALLTRIIDHAHGGA